MRTHRTLVPALVCAAILSAPAPGQWDDAEKLEERYRAKLSKPFLDRIEWYRRLDPALAAAKEERKPLLAYFTRSYAP